MENARCGQGLKVKYYVVMDHMEIRTNEGDDKWHKYRISAKLCGVREVICTDFLAMKLSWVIN